MDHEFILALYEDDNYSGLDGSETMISICNERVLTLPFLLVSSHVLSSLG